MVKNFAEWCTAVEAERAKLFTVTDYLSDDGRARLDAFSALCDLIDFSDTPKDILEWYDNAELWKAMPMDKQVALSSTHLCASLTRLLKIAEEDESNA